MKLIFNILFTIAVVLFCNGCAINSGLRNSEKWLPEDFDPKKSTLLILATTNKSSGIEKWNNEIKKHYPYKFRVIPMNTKFGEGSRFTDTTKYKYLLQCAMATGNIAFNSDGSSRNTGYTRDWRFVDLVNQKEYPYTKQPAQGQLTTLVRIFKTIKEKYNYKKK